MKTLHLLSSIALTGALLFSPIVFGTTSQSNEKYPPQQVKVIQKIVHDYLVNNPQILVEVSKALQKQEQAKVEQKAQIGIMANTKELFRNPNSPVVGDLKGDVTLVEFYDYQCHYSKQMASVISKLMQNDPKLRIVLKELAFFGSNSREAAKASLAAYKQGMKKFLKFHNALLAAKNPLTPNKIMTIAKSAGLNIDQLKKGMKAPAIETELQTSSRLAKEIGIVGTPSFVLGNQQTGQSSNSVFIPGATTEAYLQTVIAKLR